jgi:flagellar biosynthesis/type III secretory pathway M-ring protein FliF/YscJ
MLQESVEEQVVLYEDVLRRREEDRLERVRLEAQWRREAAVQEERRRKDEEEERLAAELAVRKEKAALLAKMKELATNEPELLAEVGMVVSDRFPLP